MKCTRLGVRPKPHGYHYFLPPSSRRHSYPSRDVVASRRLFIKSSLGVVRPNQLQSLKYGFNERPVGLLAGTDVDSNTSNNNNNKPGIGHCYRGVRGFWAVGVKMKSLGGRPPPKCAPPCSLASNRGPLSILVAETRDVLQRIVIVILLSSCLGYY